MRTIEVALSIIEEDGRWLVSRRAAHVDFGGFWEFPGGRIEPGEEPAGAAVREAREEVGVSIAVAAALGCVPGGGRENPVNFHLFHCCRLAGEPRAADPAVTEVRWVDAAELRTLPMPPANRRIVEKLFALGLARDVRKPPNDA